MTSMQWIVSAGGLGLIAWVNYYFFLAGRRVGAAALSAGVQRVSVTVDGGYEPSEIRVRAGLPVRLDFDRKDRGSCTDEVVLGDFGIRTFLPPGRITPVQFTPARPGTYQFTCGMGMLHGKLIVTEAP
jgi:plastocyanin domain-containing protein